MVESVCLERDVVPCDAVPGVVGVGGGFASAPTHLVMAMSLSRSPSIVPNSASTISEMRFDVRYAS